MDRIIIKRLLRGLWVIIAAVLIAVAIYLLFPLLYPFAIAWIIAYAMNPLVKLLQHRARFPRWLAVTLSLILYFGAIAVVLSAAITRMVKEVISLTTSFDLHVDEIKDTFVRWTQNDTIQSLTAQINEFYKENPNYQETINSNISKTTETVGTAVTDLVTGFFNMILSLLTSLPNMGAVLIVVLLSTFFISKSWTRHGITVSGWVPSSIRKPISDIWTDLKKALFGYVRAQLIMISITALFVMIGLLILQVNSAFTIALMIGLVDLLPYLGVGLVMVPWAAYLFMNGDLYLGIGISIIYLILLIARQIIEPKVLASSVGLDPLATLVGMFVGLKLFGVLGLIIGPVSLVILDAFNRANVLRDLRTYIINGRVR
ncbi:sporulation integral membrane protein YtvI [Paenibacillus sp. FSL k6-2145]|uniref:sporulation integral membrane protein YtvI n=1 Tax=Paenibacillus sp. FSL k6-2145 TaxID=2976834 RepID=UPI0030D8F340